MEIWMTEVKGERLREDMENFYNNMEKLIK